MLKTRRYKPITPNNVVKLFILYKLDLWPSVLNTGFTLGGCMFWGVKLIKNADPDEYSSSGYGIRFDTSQYHSLPDGRVGKNVIIFGVYMSSSVHIDSKRSDILFLGKGPTQGWNHTLKAD